MPGEEFIVQELMRTGAAVASMSAKIDGFLSAQAAMQAEINQIKGDISSVRTDVHEIKQQRAITKSYIGGIAAAVGLFWAGFSAFVWPFLKEKFGL